MTGISTILFTDVAGSTEMLARLGDDAAEGVRRSHFERMRDLTYAHRGRVVKGLGDGLMVTFQSPLAAVRCAIAMQQAEGRAEPATRVRLRVGLDAGEPIEDDGDLHGTAVVVAKRLCDAAAPGQILISDLVAQLVRSRVGDALEAVGSLTLKGLPEPTVSHQVTYDPHEARGGGEDKPAGPLSALRPTFPRRIEDELNHPMIGREEELKRLRVAWREACAGRSGLMTIGGEAGIGKTRLASALVHLVVESGGTVLFGECEEDARLVYQPWTAALRRDMQAREPLQLRRLLGGSGELMRLVPELHQRVPELPEPVRDDLEGQRGRLFASAAGYLAAVARETPVLVLLEDVHWADQSTLDLLNYLQRSFDRESVLIVATYRDWEVTDGLAALLAGLARRVQHAAVRLGGLSVEEVERLACDRLGADSLPPGFAAAVHAHTDGNVFFIEEVLRDLGQSGEVSASSVAGVPANVRAAIALSVAKLTEDTRDLLTMASVVGRRFDLELLTEVAQGDEDEVLRGLEEAQARGLVDETAGRFGGYAFAHALVREVLRSQLSRVRRARLHLRVAEALELRHADAEVQPTAELAYHFLAAEEPRAAGKAASYAEAAGVKALERLGYVQAVEFFTSALAALDLQTNPDQASRGRLLVHHGEALSRAGRMIDARTSFNAAVEIGRALNDGLLVAAGARGVGGGWFRGAGATDSEFLETMALAIDLLGEEHEALRIQLRAGLAAEQRGLTPWHERDELTRRALEASRRGGDKRTQAEALVARHWVLLGVPHVEERVALVDELINQAVRSGDRENQLLGLVRRHSDAKELGMAGVAADSLAEYEAVADEVGGPYFIYQAALTRAAYTMSTGTAVDAQRQLEIAAGLFATIEPLPVLIESFQANAAALLHLTCQHEAILGIIEEMLESGEEIVPAWRSGYASQLACMGRNEDASKVLDELGLEGYVVKGDPQATVSLSACAITAYRVGSTVHAAPLAALLKPFENMWVELHLGGPHYGPVPMFLGLLAALDGRPVDADRLLEHAASMAASFGSRRFEAEALAYRAEISSRAGDPAAARTYAEHAQELVDGSGWEPVLREAASLT